MDVQAGQAAPVVGLTAAEAEARRRRGEANIAVGGTSRSYATILRTNVFSFYNIILFVIGAALLALGRYSDAFISVGLGLLNAVISAVQEIRAKRKLDRLQLLDRAPVAVVRDGREVEVPPEAGRARRRAARPARRPDRRRRAGAGRRPGRGRRVAAHRRVRPGRQGARRRPAVGQLLRRRRRATSSPGTSARASYASRLTAEARRATTDKTPLQRRIEFVVRLVMVLVALMSGAILAAGRARGLHPAAGRADHRGAVRAGALRPVLPHRRRLHRRRGPDRRPRRAGAAGQRGRVGQQRRRRLHRQDRHADHRPARRSTRSCRSAGTTPPRSSALLGSMARSAADART